MAELGPVWCNECGYTWEIDPVYQVECPHCHAPARQFCRRPSEHSGPFVHWHTDRDLAAAAAGKYDHLCTKVPPVEKPPEQQLTLF